MALEYRVSGQGLRTVHPHVLYRASTGHTFLDAYQLDGYTTPGRELPGWRAFDLAQIVSAEPLPGTFAPSHTFNPSARKYRAGSLASVSD